LHAKPAVGGAALLLPSAVVPERRANMISTTTVSSRYMAQSLAVAIVAEFCVAPYDDNPLSQRPMANPAKRAFASAEREMRPGFVANPKKEAEILGISVGPNLDTAVDLTDFVNGLRASGRPAPNGPVDNRENTSMSGAPDAIAVEFPVSQAPARMGTVVS
jgi:hypothetical protein